MSDDFMSWIGRTGANAGTRTGTQRPATASTPAAVVLVKDDGGAGYKAFGHGHPESSMIDIRTRAYQGESGRGELLPLHYLMRTSYTFGPLGDHVTLHFADCLVTVSGRNLGELRDALMGGKVGFIEEHDPARWGATVGSGPVVDKIEVIAPGRSSGRA